MYSAPEGTKAPGVEKHGIRQAGVAFEAASALIGVFRRGNKSPVLLGEEKRAELQERGRALCKPS